MVKLNIELPAGFLDEEIRCQYKITSKMKEVWAVELDLLKRFLEACNKYNLKCYADAGTLLGAVRHQGFIPWDDDIDLVMFRDDYDKMVKIADKEFEKPYFFQNSYSEKNYFRGHAQFRNTDTTGILCNEMEKGYLFNQGIFLDIFVLDGVTEKQWQLLIQKKKIGLLRKLIMNLIRPEMPVSLKGKAVRMLLNLFHVDYRTLCKLVDTEFRKYSISRCEMVAPLSFIFETKKRIRNKHLYDEIIWIPFEFMEIPVPAKYDEFLTQRYGDYMKLAQIPTTHGTVFFDTDKSYKEYLQ